MLSITNNYWKELPMNSPPMSCTQCTGQGNFIKPTLHELITDMCGGLIINPDKINSVRSGVNAGQGIELYLSVIDFHYPGFIRLMVTSSQGATHTSLSGNRPYLGPSSFLSIFALKFFNVVTLSQAVDELSH